MFFHLPANYDGSVPVKLRFTTVDGKLVRSYTLPVKPQPQHHAKSVVVKKHEKHNKLHPGMNRFQWDLRYPTAVDVNGIYHTYAAARKPLGPEVLPGKYYVVLDYGTTTQKHQFEVKLDPRLHTSAAGLQLRFKTLMALNHSITSLSTQLNSVIALKNKLRKAIDSQQVDSKSGKQALAVLNGDIQRYVDLRIQAGEGVLVYPPRLRAWLSSIVQKVSFEFVRPTPAMLNVANMYINDTTKAVARMKSDAQSANELLGANR